MKKQFMSWAGWEIFVLLRTACDFKLMNCLFLEFSIEYFRTMVYLRYLKPWKVEPSRRETAVLSSNSL
jgi:hypothetical protein